MAESFRITKVICFIVMGTVVDSVRVFRNTIDPGIYGTNGGATLLEPQSNSTDILEGLTMCLRFNQKILGSVGFDRGMILRIGDWQAPISP